MTIEIESEVVASFVVPGRPRTKGSMKVITPRGRKPIMIEDHALSEPWRKAIKQAIWATYPDFRKPWHKPCTDPVMVTAVFLFEQPETGVGQFLPWPTLNAGANASGDLDKLNRNLLDALQGAHVIADDCLVVGISTVKRWCNPGETGGLQVMVSRA